MVVIGIDAVLAAPFKAGVITTTTLIGGVNALVQLFDHKAEQRRTAEAREATAEARGKAAAAERDAAEARGSGREGGSRTAPPDSRVGATTERAVTAYEEGPSTLTKAFFSLRNQRR